MSSRAERAESELEALRKHAYDLARERKERVTSVHLLAATSSRKGAVADLFAERRLGGEMLLKAGRSFDEDDPEALNRCIGDAREVEKRARIAGPGEPSGVHVLLAVLANRRLAAHRALLQCGVDIARLRAAALQLAIGFVAPRRIVTERVPAPASTKPSLLGAEKRASVVPLRPTKAAPLGTAVGEASVVPVVDARHGHDAKRAVPRRPLPRKTLATGPVVDMASLRVLSTVGRNLSALAADGAFDHIVERDGEIEHALDVLIRESSRGALFIGRSGTGTTAAMHALARRITEDGRLAVELSLAALLSAAGPRVQLAGLREELTQSGAAVTIFADDLHELTGLGDEIVAELRLLVGIAHASFVGATTPEGHRRMGETASSFLRAFSPIEVEEPEVEEAFLMVRSRAALLERHHDVRFSDEAVAATIAWTKRYVPGLALPAKAVAALDLAGARARRRPGVRREVLGETAVAEVIAELGNIPIDRLQGADGARMLLLEGELEKRVIGHADALARIAAHIRRNAAGLRAGRPIGSFLLLGPTGVGKTETAKALADILFGAPSAMTRVDLSEYAEAHSVARLIGAPPGYVGHEAGGQLTEAVRQRPYQVVLLDEIEKAHRDVLQAFLQVFDEGHLTDGRGRRVDFTNVIVVLTSNIGAREVEAERSKRGVGFASSSPVASAKLEATSVAAAKRELPPELFNRLDEVLFFTPLTREEVARVAELQLEKLGERLEARGVHLNVDPLAIEALLDTGGFDPALGARPMRRAIERLVEAPIAEMFLEGALGEGSVVLVSVEDGALSIDRARPESAPRSRKVHAHA